MKDFVFGLAAAGYAPSPGCSGEHCVSRKRAGFVDYTC